MDNIAEGIWLTGELLTPDECTQLVALSHKNGYRDALLRPHGRHNRESFLRLPDIARAIADRLKSEICNEKLLGFRVSEISSTIQCYLYEEGDCVDPHYDASEHLKDGAQTSLTLVIYLNDEFTGGATGFPDLGIELSAPPGHGVLFRHSLLHEGKRVITGEKYVVITFW